MGSDDDEILKRWADQARYEAFTNVDRQPRNFLEIQHIPKGITSRSLASLLIVHSKITPKKLDICYKSGQGFEGMEQVAVIEYKSERDALVAADRMRMSAFGKKWSFRIVKNPRLSNPEQDMINQWLN